MGTPSEWTSLQRFYTFSKVFPAVLLHRKYARQLTFENFCLVVGVSILDQGNQYRGVCSKNEVPNRQIKKIRV
jgi:hypothetical protein